MVIRQASSPDAPAVAALHARSWRSAYRGLLSDQFLEDRVDEDRRCAWRQRFAELRPDAACVFIAEDDGGPIGFACVRLEEGPRVLLDNLHVAPDRKRRGIGRRLVAEVARWTVEHAPGSVLYLWVLEKNVEARGFYRVLGATERDVEDHRVADGSCQPALRCEWVEPRVLLDRLTAD